MNRWQVELKRKLGKRINKLPKNIQEKTAALVNDLKANGVFPGKKWNNYSPLEGKKHHCHLTYSYVACWEEVDDKLRLIEVYYVGSREDAPY
jgi:hypothetical protein